MVYCSQQAKQRVIVIMTYGYARCSTNETMQDITRQIRELEVHGAQRIFQEFEHGDSVVKAQLEAMFDTAEAGDTIVTTEVSRLSRSTKQLCGIIELVQQKRLKLEIMGSITIDCRNGELDPMTDAFLKMAGVFSELETKMLRARVRSGIENARAKGKRIGRPERTVETIPLEFLKYYPRWKNGELTKMEVHKLTNLSRVTIDKYIRMIEGR